MSKVDNFVGCQDEESDTDDEESIQKVDSLLEDGILFSYYSPSAMSCSNSSKHKGVSNSNTQDLPPNIDLDTESHQAAKEICYLPGTDPIIFSTYQVQILLTLSLPSSE